MGGGSWAVWPRGSGVGIRRRVVRRPTSWTAWRFVSVRKAAVLASLFAFAALGAAQAAHVNPKRGYFGFGPRFADMGDGMAAIRVVDVYDDGPAAPAGVVRGDLIIAIEGAPFRFKGDLELLEWLKRFTAGTSGAARGVRDAPERLLLSPRLPHLDKNHGTAPARGSRAHGQQRRRRLRGR